MKQIIRQLELAPAVLCIALAGCVQSTVKNADVRPEWINEQPRDYPNASYVYATGSASDSEVAKDRAQANLSKIFELRIQESSTTTQDVQAHKANGVESVQSSARIASKVSVHTSKMMNGVRIAEQWQNPDDLTYYALAVLDRSQASNSVRDEINRLDREIAFTMMNAGSRENTLHEIGELQRAIVMQAERNSLQKTLKILDLHGKGKPSSQNLAELKSQQMQLLQSLNMKGLVTADPTGELDKVLQGAMSNAGFIWMSGNVDYTLSASMETQESMQKQGWYWLRGTLKLRLVDADGSVLGNRTWPLKVSSQQENQLQQRMLAEVDRKLKAELKDTVLGFATGNQ